MKFLVFFILLYCSGVLSFFLSAQIILALHYILLLLCISSFCLYSIKNKWTKITICLFLYAIAFPIYGSLCSSSIFGQPILLGIVSLRYLDYIFFGFFLLLIKYNYQTLIRQINILNISIAIFSITAILILGINPSEINSFQVSNNVLGGASESVTTGIRGVNIRGTRFTACSRLIIISLVYYFLSIIKIGGKKNWAIFILFIIYMLFVNKGRQFMGVLGIVYIIYLFRYKKLTYKTISLIFLPIIGFLVVLMIDSNITVRFTSAIEGNESKDFSVLARMHDIDVITPYIERHPILGVGNLSPHFKNGGFQAYFGKQFYISDIGIFGTIVRGGLLLVAIYFLFYYLCWKKTYFIWDHDTREFLQYMIISYFSLFALFFHDTMNAEGSICIGLVLFPLFSSYNPNKFTDPISTPLYSKGRI